MEENKKSEIFDASFRIISINLDPDQISNLLGMKPDHSHKKGDPNNRKSKSGKVIVGSPYKTGVWAINSNLPEGSSIEEHIGSILDRLEPISEKIKHLSGNGCRVDIYCGYFFEHGIRGGFNLSPSLLEQMGKMGINFSFGTYEML